MESIFTIGEILLAGLVFIFNLLEMSSAVSLSFSVSFVVLVVYLVYRAITSKVDSMLLVLIIISGFNVLLNGGFNIDAVINFDYFKKLIFFWTSIIFFWLASKVTITQQTARIIKSIVFALSAFLLIDYYILGNRVMLGRYLTLNFTNPNFTAMWLLHLELFMVYYFFTTESMVEKVFIIAALSLLLAFVFLFSD